MTGRTTVTLGHAVLALLYAGVTCAQTHVENFGDFTVRSTVVAATSLSPQATREYGIERGRTVGVLDVAVARRAAPYGPTVRALIAASSADLLGHSIPIALRAVTTNERISYLGTFEFEPGRLRRFEITVQPEGTLLVFTHRFDEQLFSDRR